jgi:hypothetical protein
VSVKVTATVEGLSDLRNALRMLNPEVERRAKAAVVETTEIVTSSARANAPVSGPEDRKAKNRLGAGELRDTIRSEYSKEGWVGYVKAGYGKLMRRYHSAERKAIAKAKRGARVRRARSMAQLVKAMQAGSYAMVVEYGDPKRNKPARPFMRRAFWPEKGRHVERIRAALRASTDTVQRKVG